jgi:hypothetical protein
VPGVLLLQREVPGWCCSKSCSVQRQPLAPQASPMIMMTRGTLLSPLHSLQDKQSGVSKPRLHVSHLLLHVGLLRTWRLTFEPRGHTPRSKSERLRCQRRSPACTWCLSGLCCWLLQAPPHQSACLPRTCLLCVNHEPLIWRRETIQQRPVCNQLNTQ